MSAIGDVIVTALENFLKGLFKPVEDIIEIHATEILKIIVGTPHPNAVFSQPTNGPWPGIYDYYWETMVPLSLFLWALSIGLVIFFESTSHLFSGYHRSKLKKRSFSGLLGILSWWWIAALSLRFVNALTGFIVPDLSDLTLFQTLSFSAMGVLGLVVSLSANLLLFLLVGLIYLVRQMALYLFVLLMPLLIVFWIPGVGPFALVAKFMQRLAGFFVPFLFMTLPVALLFRLGGLLGESFELSAEGFGAWLTALVVPLLAVVAPLVLFWQAGALFFMADRVAQHTSAQRARHRAMSIATSGPTTARGGRNFVRGLRARSPVRPWGVSRAEMGTSRAHLAGRILRDTGVVLQRGFRDRISRGGSEPLDLVDIVERVEDADADARGGRTYDFQNLQDRKRSEKRDRPAADDPPRYIQ